ncbi:hypothetical protein N7507_009343 [Penicillium longicatenatum]|nr:hypothetical protein N7507_009343 [Penicillium longicatenatum]
MWKLSRRRKEREEEALIYQLVIAKFSSPVAAITAIDWGVLWDGNCLSTVLMTRLHAYVSATITKK